MKMENIFEYKAILFDIDGVLIQAYDTDNRYLWDKNIERDLGISLHDLSKYLFDSSWCDVLLGKIPLEKKVSILLEKIDSTVSAQEFISYWLYNDTRIDQRMLDIAKNLREKDIHVYLATNQERRRMEYLWNELSFKKYFDDYFVSYQMGVMKSDVTFFKNLITKLKVDTADIFYIDDVASNLMSASKIGIAGYHFTTYEKFIEVFSF